MAKSKLPKIGGCAGRNGYYGVTNLEFNVNERIDQVDINFYGLQSKVLNAGGHVDIASFIISAKAALYQLGYTVIKQNVSR